MTILVGMTESRGLESHRLVISFWWTDTTTVLCEARRGEASVDDGGRMDA